MVSYLDHPAMILYILMGNKQSKTRTSMHVTLMLGRKLGIKYLVNMRRWNSGAVVSNLNPNRDLFFLFRTFCCN